MNTAPASISDGLLVKASTNYDGSNPVSEYNPANIGSYKYFESMVPPSTFSATVSVNKTAACGRMWQTMKLFFPPPQQMRELGN